MRVHGDSMVPTLRPGEFVLLDETAIPHSDSIVVVDHPQFDTLLIKRVASDDAAPPDRMWLLSDNPVSGTDSRSFGSIHPSWVVGVVTMVLDRPFFTEPSFL